MRHAAKLALLEHLLCMSGFPLDHNQRRNYTTLLHIFWSRGELDACQRTFILNDTAAKQILGKRRFEFVAFVIEKGNDVSVIVNEFLVLVVLLLKFLCTERQHSFFALANTSAGYASITNDSCQLEPSPTPPILFL